MEKYMLSPEMVRTEDSKPDGHQFKDIEVNGGKTHFGDSYNYHSHHDYTPPDPQKELDEKIDSCRNVLFLTDPVSDLESLKSTKGQRTNGTCEWIRDNEHYKAWLCGETQCLSVCGGPGKGKTMLSIFLTEELECHTKAMGSTELLFYFCSHQDENRNSAITVLRSLLYQLLPKCRESFTSVSSYFGSSERIKITLSSADTLWVILRTIIQSKSRTTYCVLDGLDECDDASSILLTTKFRDFFSSAHSGKLKLMIVSRKIAGLEVFPQVKLDPDNDDHLSRDIQHFISASVQGLERINGFNNIRENVEATLLKRAQGTFLWVGFVMGELSKKRTCSGIMRSLEDLPPGLDAIYSRMLLQATRSWQMESDEQNIMSDILCWVTMAVRPLTLHELTVAITLSTAVSNEQAIRDQITLCEPILTVQGLKVNLVHQSASDYLLREKPDHDPILKDFRIEAPKAHAQIARTCLDYIEKSDLRHEYLNIVDESVLRESPLLKFRYEYLNIEDASLLRESPLLNYAVLHWLEHARHSSMYGGEDYRLSRAIFCQESPVRKNWWKAYINSEKQRINGKTPWTFENSPCLLHIASYFGIDSLVQKLITKAGYVQLQQLIDRKDLKTMEALELASEGGHETAVQLLLTKADKVNSGDSDYRTELSVAALLQHEAIVQLLLAEDIGVYIDDGEALSLACYQGHEAIIQVLLSNGADVNAAHGTALINAARKGHEAIARLLLENGAYVNTTDNYGTTALIAAAESRCEAIARLLLANGAYVDAQQKFGTTALIAAAESRCEAIVRLLLANGAYVDAQHEFGTTALIAAAERGHEAIVRLLLANGAHVNVQHKFGTTALIAAAERGHEAIVQMLKSAGASSSKITKR